MLHRNLLLYLCKSILNQRMKLLQLLKTNSMDIKSLILNLENYSKDEVTYTIRSMIDYDIIRLNNDELSLI